MVLVKNVTATMIVSYEHNLTLYFLESLMKESEHGCLNYTPS
jgi:hypothetical protein